MSPIAHAGIETHGDKKRGCEIFIVRVLEPLPEGRFLELLASAKRCGGWYHERWLFKSGGFAFDIEVVARAWAHVELG